MPMQPL